MWFCRHDDAALRPFARGLDPATFRLWGFELGPRSHLHSEEWMCFFGPDASFRDLQRLTASHGHVPRCPILARHEGFPHERSGGVVALSSICMICLATDACKPIRPPLRDALLACPTTRLETQSPPTRKAEARQRFHVGDMTVARAGQRRAKGKEGMHADFGPLVQPERSTPKDVDPFVPRLQRFAPCSPFSTRCRAPRVAHEDGRPGWNPSVRTSCAKAHSPVQPREGMHFPLDRGAFHRWNPTTEGIAPCVVGQALCATHPTWGFADEE